MYCCEACGARFDAPTLRRWREPMPDGFYENWCAETCPECGAEDIEETEGADDEG